MGFYEGIGMGPVVPMAGEGSVARPSPYDAKFLDTVIAVRPQSESAMMEQRRRDLDDEMEAFLEGLNEKDFKTVLKLLETI